MYYCINKNGFIISAFIISIVGITLMIPLTILYSL